MTFTIKAHKDPCHFSIEGDHMAYKDFRAEFFAISGFFGEHGPHVFAAAPDLLDAASALIADVRARYPGEELRCEYMRCLDAAGRHGIKFRQDADIRRDTVSAPIPANIHALVSALAEQRGVAFDYVLADLVSIGARGSL